MRIKLGRPSPALVIACISLFVALGGVGYAAATGSIDGREIKNNSVASKDIKNNSVAGGDVKTSTLKGADVASNTLTGSDVNESSLGKVPSAASADSAATAGSANTANSAGNANTVGGQRVISFVDNRDSTTTQIVQASISGIEVRTSCASSDVDFHIKNVSGATARLTYSNVGVGEDQTESDTIDVTNNSTITTISNLNPDDDATTGQASVATAGGRVVRILYTMNEDDFGFDCNISGTVIG